MNSNFMQFQEITDKQWNMIMPHLPRPAKTGRPRADDRTMINAIMFVLITGCRWIDLPARYGSKSSAHRRFQDLQQKGVWKKILTCAIKSAHNQNKLNLQKISVDSSSIHAKKREM
jgi:transposase